MKWPQGVCFKCRPETIMAAAVYRQNSAVQVIKALAQMMKPLLGQNARPLSFTPVLAFLVQTTLVYASAGGEDECVFVHRLKCVVEEDGNHSKLFGCAAQVMQALDTQHPMYNVINSVVQTHHDVQVACCKSLIVMSGLWLSVMEELIHSGIPTSDVLAAFHAGLDYCIQCISESPVTVKFDDLLNETEHLSSSLETSLAINLRKVSLDEESENFKKPVSVRSIDRSTLFDDQKQWEKCLQGDSKSSVCEGTLQDDDLCHHKHDNCPPADLKGTRSANGKSEDENNLNDDVRWFFDTESDAVVDDSIPISVKSTFKTSCSHERPSTACDAAQSEPISVEIVATVHQKPMNGNSRSPSEKVISSHCHDEFEEKVLGHCVTVASRKHTSIPGRLVFDSGSHGSNSKTFGSSGVIVARTSCSNPNDATVRKEPITMSPGGSPTLRDDFVEAKTVARTAEGDRKPLGKHVNAAFFKSENRSISKPAAGKLFYSSNMRMNADGKPTAVGLLSRHAGILSRFEIGRSPTWSERSGVLCARVRELGMRLSHGCDDMMEIAVRICLEQMDFHKRIGFRLSRVHTMHLAGTPADRTCVVSGCLLRTTSLQLALLSQAQRRNALLINGDVTIEYRHPGYQKHAGLNVIGHSVASSTPEERWLSETMDVIAELQVTALLVKGAASGCLVDRCHQMNIMVVTSVPYRALVSIGQAARASLCQYVTECCQDTMYCFSKTNYRLRSVDVSLMSANDCIELKENVAENIAMLPWRSDWMDTTMSHHFITVQPPTDLIQTAVVCNPVADLAMINEDRLLHCIRRLRGLVESRRVLRGAGRVEDYCSQQLDQLADKYEKHGACVLQNAGHFSVAGLRAMSTVFRAYRDAVSSNHSAGLCSEQVSDKSSSTFWNVYDDYETKIAAWRTSLYIASLTVLTDFEVVATDSISRGPLDDIRVIGYL